MNAKLDCPFIYDASQSESRNLKRRLSRNKRNFSSMTLTPPSVGGENGNNKDEYDADTDTDTDIQDGPFMKQSQDQSAAASSSSSASSPPRTPTKSISQQNPFAIPDAPGATTVNDPFYDNCNNPFVNPVTTPSPKRQLAYDKNGIPKDGRNLVYLFRGKRIDCNIPIDSLPSDGSPAGSYRPRRLFAAEIEQSKPVRPRNSDPFAPDSYIAQPANRPLFDTSNNPMAFQSPERPQSSNAHPTPPPTREIKRRKVQHFR